MSREWSAGYCRSKLNAVCFCKPIKISCSSNLRFQIFAHSVENPIYLLISPILFPSPLEDASLISHRSILRSLSPSENALFSLYVSRYFVSKISSCGRSLGLLKKDQTQEMTDMYTRAFPLPIMALLREGKLRLTDVKI